MLFRLPGNAKTLTVDGSESQTVLPNLTPGVTYEATVVAMKGQRESEPGSDSVTTGETYVELTLTHIPYLQAGYEHIDLASVL